MGRYRVVYIPKKYVRIFPEKVKRTRHIMDKSGLMKGRKIVKTQIPATRVIRMAKDYSGFEEGQIIGRTKKEYPRQLNSVLVRSHNRGKKLGSIKSIRVRRYIRKK